MGEKRKTASATQLAHAINVEVQKNPSQTLAIIQKTYDQKVGEGDAEGADLALTIRSIAEARGESIPEMASRKWVLIFGGVTVGMTFLFLVVLVFLSVFGHPLPQDARGTVAVIVALGLAVGLGLIGGDAAASGKIPISEKYALTFSVGGGIAVFVILLGVLRYFYVL